MNLNTCNRPKQSKCKIIVSVGLFCLIVLLFLITSPGKEWITSNLLSQEKDYNNITPSYFHPDSLSTDELTEYKAWKAKLKSNGYQFSHLNKQITKKSIFKSKADKSSSYARGKITGQWKRKYFSFDSPINNIGPNNNGYRVLESAYDAMNDQFYAVSSSGSLYKMNETPSARWLLLSNKTSLLNSGLSSFNLSDGSYRMLMQSDNGPMKYSNDEGRTWLNADGALFENNWNYNTMVTDYNGGTRIVAFGSRYVNREGYYRVYLSTDNGLNFFESSQNNWSHEAYQTRVIKVNNSNAVAAFVRDKTSKKVQIYTMTENDNDLIWRRTTTQTFDDLTAVVGTYANNAWHFYINDGKSKIYYSDDVGENWTLTNSSNESGVIIGVHPTKPNVVFKGIVQLYISSDNGATWTDNQWVLTTYCVWDIRHMRFYKKADGTDIAFVGTDFGGYYSEYATDWNSWQTLNFGSPILMCYDAIFSEINNVGYTAQQDRGAQGYVDNQDSTYQYIATDVAHSDVLRVCLANNESSMWYLYYYGTLGRTDVTNTAEPTNSISTGYIYEPRKAYNIIASPNENEDAIYIAVGTQLEKWTKNGSTLERSYHHYKFPNKIATFNYSEIDTKLWYVCDTTGQLYYSTNAGNSFTASTYSGAWPGREESWARAIQVIKACPIDEKTVYFAGVGNSFLKSTDNGKTFSNHTNGLNVDRFRDFDISGNGKFIFAACGQSGAWVYSVDDNYWYPMNDGPVDKADYSTVQYINSKNIVRFTSIGGGITDLLLAQDLSKGL